MLIYEPMRMLLVIFSLFIASCLGHSVVVQGDALRFYIVSDGPIAGGRYIDTPDCPKVGYVANTPNLTVTRLQSVTTNVTEGTFIESVIVIQLCAPDAKVLADLTRRNVGRRILISLGARPLVAPIVAVPIEDGDCAITTHGKATALESALKGLVRP
jgi:hypothetical protein